MKNKLLLSVITIIFLSSCANKFSLTKRKYTKGYYIASSSHNSATKKESDHKKVDVATNLPSKATPITKKIESPEITIIKNNEGVEFSKITITHPKTSKPQTTTNHLVASAKSQKVMAVKPDVKPVAEKQVYNKTKKGDSDANLILLVILSLFPILALVAIYLHDGKSVTINFWIDLLLHLIFLYWLFALLVVLDVIDLR